MFKRLLGNRLVILTVGVLAIIALFLLSAGLPSFKFDETGGLSLSQYQIARQQGAMGLEADMSWFQTVVYILLGLSAVALIFALIDPVMRKWLLKKLPYALLILAILVAMSNFNNNVPPDSASATPYENGGPPASQPNPGETFAPPQISSFSAFVVALVVILSLMGIAYYMWRRFSSREILEEPLQQLSRIVQATLDDMAAGRDWEDAVIQCYLRMSETVNIERGLQRRQAMTPAEFAERLVGAGLPSSAVHRLTQLFESVRYGAKQSSRADVDEAVSCLRVIVEACRGEA